MGIPPSQKCPFPLENLVPHLIHGSLCPHPSTLWIYAQTYSQPELGRLQEADVDRRVRRTDRRANFHRPRTTQYAGSRQQTVISTMTSILIYFNAAGQCDVPILFVQRRRVEQIASNLRPASDLVKSCIRPRICLRFGRQTLIHGNNQKLH